jgi:hypothetical protein
MAMKTNHKYSMNHPHDIEKKYRLSDVKISFLRKDILIFCRYCLQHRSSRKKQHRITVYDVWNNLIHYDYNYYPSYKYIKAEIQSLFPLYNYSHKRNRFFKINTQLVDYWGKKFDIKYEQHEGVNTVFKSLEYER